MRQLVRATTAEAAEFIQLAKAIALSKGDFRAAIGHAEACGFPRAPAILKAASSAATFADPAWAADAVSYDGLAVAFQEGLRNYGAFDALFSSMVKLPMQRPVTIVTEGLIGDEVSEGEPIPIRQFAIAASAPMAPRKAVAHVVLSEEIYRAANQSMFGAELRTAVAVTTDSIFVDVLATGASLSVIASGSTAEAFLRDLANAAAQIRVNSRSELFLLVDAETCARLALMPGADGARALPDLQYDGGEVGGIRVVTTDGIQPSTSDVDLLLIDAAQIAADTLTVTLAASRQATVQMSTTPDNPASASTVVVPLWQNNLIGLRATRFFGFMPLFSTAVVRIVGTTYGQELS